MLTQVRVNTGAPVFDSYDSYLAGYGDSLVNMGNDMAADVSIAVVSGGPPSEDALALTASRGPEFAVTVNAVTVTQPEWSSKSRQQRKQGGWQRNARHVAMAIGDGSIQHAQ